MTDEKSGRRIAQIDLSLVGKQSRDLEELFDVLIAEARKNEKDYSWDSIKKDLKRKGRI